MGDFETTVYKGQKFTEVWASALVPLYTEDVVLLHSIEDTWKYLTGLHQNVVVYYHNLKFDGTFWLDFFIRKTKLKQAIEVDEAGVRSWIPDKNMPVNTYKYAISDMGQWYYILIRLHHRTIEIRDSLKLLPFSVKQLGQSFATKHKKLDMVYEGFRYAGCEITPEEQEYIKNDVLVVKEALEIMFDQGHDDLTIGACCMTEFKKTFMPGDYKTFFPNLYAYVIDKKIFGSSSAGEYIHRAYRGGWCYLVKGKENQVFTHGTTADVNSLYPSMMHSMSGNKYPVGRPNFWKGPEIPEIAKGDNKFFFVRLRCRFRIRPGFLPFMQIKGSTIYKATEMLESSDYRSKSGKLYRWYRTRDGHIRDTTVTLTLTESDYYLVKKHYILIDEQILDGCWFYAEKGIFDAYIDKYKKIKQESKGAIRTLAKMFLNNLYGKLAASQESSFKYTVLREDGSIDYRIQPEQEKKPGYIACGAAITAYARRFTIEAAQANYHGPDLPGFIYADTDSIHCDLDPDLIKGAPQHPTEFCHWKYESCWDKAVFVRQKTYIEHITHEDLEPVKEPFFAVRCAGMPDKCKDLFVKSITQDYKPEEHTQEELAFLHTQRSMEDFRQGLSVPGKLLPKQIPGGTVLVDTPYEIR